MIFSCLSLSKTLIYSWQKYLRVACVQRNIRSIFCTISKYVCNQCNTAKLKIKNAYYENFWSKGYFKSCKVWTTFVHLHKKVVWHDKRFDLGIFYTKIKTVVIRRAKNRNSTTGGRGRNTLYRIMYDIWVYSQIEDM